MAKIYKTQNLIGDGGMVEKKDILGGIFMVYSLVLFFLLAFLGFLAILY